MEYWEPPPLWKNEAVFIVGGGPSLRGFDFNLLQNRHVLAINEAYIDIPWAEVLFFRDCEWFERARPDLIFGGLMVTTSPRAKEECSLINLVELNTPQMPRARTGGHNAVSLALTMEAKRIVLLGFDWNPDGGNYHNRHPNQGLRYRGGLLDSWKTYRERAEREGKEILNATPGSGIDEFERVDFGQIIRSGYVCWGCL